MTLNMDQLSPEVFAEYAKKYAKKFLTDSVLNHRLFAQLGLTPSDRSRTAIIDVEGAYVDPEKRMSEYYVAHQLLNSSMSTQGHPPTAPMPC